MPALTLTLGCVASAGCAASASTQPNDAVDSSQDAGSGSDATGGGPTSGGDAGQTDAATGDGSQSSKGDAAVLSRGPTPAQNGTSYPFPQNRQSAHCTYPTAYDNAAALAAYDKWKTDTVTSSGAGGFRRVQRPNEPGLLPQSTVSEGIGYGMLIAAYMGDESLFDDLWSYEQLWVDKAGLMNWYVLADGSGLGPNGSGGATDADEDMAFALALAEKQWGGQGTLSASYHDLAVKQIQAVWAAEIQDSKLPKPGEWGGWNTVNVSYFAPSYYRVFATLDPGHPWSNVVQTVYDTIAYAVTAANGNQSNGLVPAWCDDSHGSPCTPIDEGIPNDTGYQYDSCRTPFRIGLDWCWNGEPRAKAYVALTSAFFSGIGAANIADSYAIDGTPKPQHPGGHSAAFVGPAGVGAMSSDAYQSLVDGAYTGVASLAYLAGGTYYEDSWTTMSLLMMTGNFVDYTSL